MKKTLYALAMLAIMIGVAPAPADAKKKTVRARVNALEKIVAKQQKQISTLGDAVSFANARAADAQDNLAALENCIFVQPAGAVDVLDATTTATFMQGDATISIPDIFQWFPVARIVITPEGPSFIALIDPACVAQPSPAPAGRAHRNGWAPRPLVLR